MSIKIWHVKNKKYRKVRDHCHAAHSIYILKYSVPKEIAVVFHNGSNCDYHFIIKGLAEEIEKQFTCLGENTDKIYNLFNLLIAQNLWLITKSC